MFVPYECFLDVFPGGNGIIEVLLYSECKLSGSMYVAHIVVLWLYTELKDIIILQLRHGIFCANLVPFLWPSHILKCLIVQNFDKPDGMAGKVVFPSFLL